MKRRSKQTLHTCLTAFLAGGFATALPAESMAQTMPETTDPDAPPPGEEGSPDPAIARTSPIKRVEENVVTQATDAFGLDIGGATIGLYNEDSARGFSPSAAGNIRIEGLYFDRQGLASARLLRAVSVRVGPTALQEVLPAPSGIVRYSLRFPGDTSGGSLVAGLEAYGSPVAELDLTYAPKDRPWRLGLGVGIAPELRDEAGGDGAIASWAVMPAWVGTGARIQAFATQKIYRELYLGPRVFVGGDALPPRIERRLLTGQRWATSNGEDSNIGLIGEIDDVAGLTFRGGLFYSLWTPDRTIAQIDLATTASGSARRVAVEFPAQSYGSLSGEGQIIRSWQSNERQHRLILSLRGRAFEGEYGGRVVHDLGMRQIDSTDQFARPAFSPGPQVRDTVRQTTLGLSYIGAWGNRAEFNIGIQKTWFDKSFTPPGSVPVQSSASPLLGNIAAGVRVARGVIVYAGYSRGLEESGTSPASASNPNVVLPPSITEQFEAGLRWTPTSEISLISGLFRITKPYANLDSSNEFGFIGQLENRGAEVSLTWRPRPTIVLVAGGLVQDPRVSAEVVELFPVSIPEVSARMDVDWTLSAGSPLSVDGAVIYSGSAPVLIDNNLRSSELLTINLGARYRFDLGKHRALLRAQVLNLTDVFAWRPQSSGALVFNPPRRFRVTLSVDF